MGSIYMITNTENGKAYIGQTIHDAEKKRLSYHLNGRGSKLIKRAVEKYGKDVFVFEILHDGVIPELLDSYEIEAIAKHNTFAPNGYNLTFGGWGGSAGGENHPMFGRKHTLETRRKMSEKSKGRKLPKSHYEKLSKLFTGRKHTPEARRKISEGLTGKKLSAEHRKKLSEAHKGIYPSEETRRKMSESRKGKQLPANRHPLYDSVYTLFMQLYESKSLLEIRKIFYDKFSGDVNPRTIRQWTTKWVNENPQNPKD